MKKTMLLLLVFSLLLCGCEVASVETVPTTIPTEPVVTTEVTESPTTAPTEPPEEHFTLTFAGDCTLGSAPIHYHMATGFIETVGENYKYPFQNVAEYFDNDDFTMINLEGVFTDVGGAANKTFTFRGPSNYIRFLTENSIEAVTLANNHTYDYNKPGYDSTTQLLRDNGIPYVEKDSSTIMTTESGLTIGMYAASFVVDMNDLAAEVADLRQQGAEVVIFAVHWGGEGLYYPHAHQVQQAYDAIDAGVDIVYGHHPHVLQKIEEYNNGVIFYSLGNFAFGGNLQPPDLDTAVLQQEFIRDAQGNIRKGELTIIPASVSSVPLINNFQPTPYEDGTEEYIRVMNKLSGGWDGIKLAVNY